MNHHKYLKNRKAQATVFMIVGIVMAFAIGISYVTYNKLVSQPFEEVGLRLENYPAEIRPAVSLVDEQMKECMKQTLSDGLFILGAQGGRIEVDSPSFDTITEKDGEFLPTRTKYGFYSESNILPDLEESKNDLDRYIENNVVLCAAEIAVPLKESGVDISFESIDSDVQFVDDKTMLMLIFKIKLSKTDIKQEISNFRIEIPVRYKYVHEKANQLIEEFVISPNQIDLTSFSEEKEMDIAYIPYGSDIIAISINDYNSNITTEFGGEDYVNEAYGFIFANKFTSENEPTLFEIDDLFEINVGENFEHQINSSENIVFISEGTLFSIDSSGFIEFTPLKSDAGIHSMKITGEDSQGNTQEKKVLFLINAEKEIYLKFIEDKTCYVDTPCAVNIDYENDGSVTFEDNTDLFEVDKTSGNAYFVPERKGIFNIKITAKSGNLNSSREFKLQVDELEKPVISGESEFKAVKGELFRYDFNSNLEEDSFVFYDASEPWFEISAFDGIAEFAPEEEGNFSINITAEDLYGNIDSKMINLVVESG